MHVPCAHLPSHMDIEFNQVDFYALELYLQYGGFLGFILIVELSVATSMYAYKDRLADGFEKGLENSMITFGPDDPTRTVDFFWMQRKVK